MGVNEKKEITEKGYLISGMHIGYRATIVCACMFFAVLPHFCRMYW